MKLEIGLYRNKITGEYEAIIDRIDNNLTEHLRGFEFVKSFSYEEKSREQILKERLKILTSKLSTEIENKILPLVLENDCLESFPDNEINNFTALFDGYKCLRKKVKIESKK